MDLETIQDNSTFKEILASVGQYIFFITFSIYLIIFFFERRKLFTSMQGVEERLAKQNSETTDEEQSDSDISGSDSNSDSYLDSESPVITENECDELAGGEPIKKKCLRVYNKVS